MASNYELEYKKIHNTLTKDAKPNAFGYKIGQRIDNLLDSYVLNAVSLVNNLPYNSYKTDIWRDNKATTETLAFDLIADNNLLNSSDSPHEFEESQKLIDSNPSIIHSDFFTPSYIWGQKGKSYGNTYIKRWYVNTSKTLFCPNTLDLEGKEETEYVARHDFRSIFNNFIDLDGISYKEEILGNKANKTLVSHKVHLEQNTNYVFQMVNRYNKWPSNSHIIVQFFIENNCLTCSSSIRMKYCQPAFEPIVLKNIQPDVAFCFKTPLLEDKKYFLPTNIPSDKKLNISQLEKPELYMIMYITNTNLDKNEWTITADSGEKYNLKDYRLFLFQSDFSYEISENGTILSYQSLKMKPISSVIYGTARTFKTVYDVVRPVLNQTRPLINFSDNAGDPYISIAFDTKLSIRNIADFKSYFTKFPDIYYKTEENEIKRILDDWDASSKFSISNEGPFSLYSETEFKKNLSNHGTIYKEIIKANPEIIGWNDGREYYSSDLTPAEIVQLLLDENKELVLVPHREMIDQTGTWPERRNRSWEGIDYTTSQSPTALRLIDSTNSTGEHKWEHNLQSSFQKSVNFFYSPLRSCGKYWKDQNGTHEMTGWTPESNYKPGQSQQGMIPETTSIAVEGANTVFKPYINIGAFRFPIFYKEKTVSSLKEEDLTIKFYVKPDKDTNAFRPKLFAEDSLYNPYSGSLGDSSWLSKTLKGIQWYRLNFGQNTAFGKITSLEKELIKYDIASTKYNAKKHYYLTNGSRTQKEFSQFASFYTLELFHKVSHAFLGDYERSFLPWVARMRSSSFTGSLTDSEGISYNNSSFVGLSFKWAIVNQAEALKKSSSDPRITGIDKNISIFGDRFGLWGRDWAAGYAPKDGATEYAFPVSKPILISQYLGLYPDTDINSYFDYIAYPPDGSSSTASDLQVIYKGTSITYTIPGRYYSTETHKPSEVKTTHIVDISPFCWGSGSIKLLSNNGNSSESTSYIAVVDNFERDKLK